MRKIAFFGDLRVCGERNPRGDSILRSFHPRPEEIIVPRNL
jgi:hypothetical protein